MPQTAVYVDITDEELGVICSTDPLGTMMMSTKAVELVQEEGRIAGMGVYLDSLIDEEREYLIAMADKRNRSIDDELSQAGPPPQ